MFSGFYRINPIQEFQAQFQGDLNLLHFVSDKNDSVYQHQVLPHCPTVTSATHLCFFLFGCQSLSYCPTLSLVTALVCFTDLDSALVPFFCQVTQSLTVIPDQAVHLDSHGLGLFPLLNFNFVHSAVGIDIKFGVADDQGSLAMVLESNLEDEVVADNELLHWRYSHDSHRTQSVIRFGIQIFVLFISKFNRT